MIKSNKSAYYYLVVLKKHIEAVGTITTTDGITGKVQEQPCKIRLSSTSEIVTGYILAEDDEKAHINAKQELEKLYPEKDGYREHEHVKVKKVEEQSSWA